MTSPLVDIAGATLSIRRGTSPTHTFAIKNRDGTAKNLVGATEITFAVAESRDAEIRDLQVLLGAGTSHDGESGIVTLVLTATQTESLPIGMRWCELWITDSIGRRDVVGEGWCPVYDTLVAVS